MATFRSNTSPSQQSPKAQRRPINKKVYTAMDVPDISVVSDIMNDADNEFQTESFHNNYQSEPLQSNYVQFQSVHASKFIPGCGASLLKTNNFDVRHMPRATHVRNIGINSPVVPKVTCHTTNKTDAFPENISKTCLQVGCQCSAVNTTTLERYNEQYTSPKNNSSGIPFPLTLDVKQSEMEFKRTSENRFCFDKASYKYLESDLYHSPNEVTCHHSNFKNYAHLPCLSNQVEPSEMAHAQKTHNVCCSENQCLKLNKAFYDHETHFSSNSECEEQRVSDNPEKEPSQKLLHKNGNVSYRNNKKKNCSCKSNKSKSKKADSVVSKKNVDSQMNAESSTKNMQMDAPSTESVNIVQCLRQQEEKISLIQEQINTILTHSTSCCTKPTSQMNVVPNATKSKFESENLVQMNLMPSSNGIEKGSEMSVILSYLKTHTEQIQKIQEQMNFLLLRTPEQNSSLAPSNKVDDLMLNEVLSTNCTSKGTCNEETEQTKSTPNIICHEQIEVTKTSTNTLTSLIFENNDKLVYRKQRTIVTDFAKHRKKVSAKCLGRDCHSPTTEHQSNVKDLAFDSSKSKFCKFNKLPGKLQLGLETPVISSSSSDVRDADESQLQKDSYPCNRLSEHALVEDELINEGNARNLPRSSNACKEKQKKPSCKKAVPKSHSHSSQEKQGTPPKIIDTPVRKSKSRKQRVQQKSSSPASNTSTDSVEPGSGHRHNLSVETQLNDENKKFSESSTIQKYGLSSPNLSVATKRYLETYGLVSDENEKIRSRTTRASLSERYIR